MKKLLLIMMAFMASFSVYAQDINTMKEVKPLSSLSNRALFPLLGTITINVTDITLPLTISAPAPVEDVEDIHGPFSPRYSFWTEQNGYLYITITEDAAPEIFNPNQQYEFVVKTKNATYYSIMFHVI